uniref:chromatin-remodeling ATPase INO80-like n=1 Tax=Ciona intestinalis TaxID=7719 RepID=UPI000EF55067|nr:chromatin-remodeling ATPase INO80-like [Ciona intestinalis]|eukprot:XP_026691135.1 chromatin-remodeling ATPase INO80-like [Ciona intestinalis]
MDRSKLRDALKLDFLIQEIKGLENLPSSDVSDTNEDDNDISITDDGPVFCPSGLGTSLDTVIKTDRQWLKDIICDESSDSETDDEYLEHELRLRNSVKFYRKTLQADPYLSKYMYFGSDVHTGDEKWFTNFESVVGKYKLKGNKSRKPGKSREDLSELDLEMHDAFMSPKFKLEQRFTSNSQWHLLGQNMQFNMNLVRQRVWKTIAKREIPKAHKQRCRNQVAKISSLKKLCKETAQYVRNKSKTKLSKEAATNSSRRQMREHGLKQIPPERCKKRQTKKAVTT